MVTPVTLRISPISMRTCTLPTHALNCSSIYSVIYSLSHSLVHSFIQLFIQSFFHSVVLSFGHSLTQSFARAFIHSFIHPSIQSCIHSFICPFEHPTHAFFCQLVHSSHIDRPGMKLPCMTAPICRQDVFYIAGSRLYTSVEHVISSAYQSPHDSQSYTETLSQAAAT